MGSIIDVNIDSGRRDVALAREDSCSEMAYVLGADTLDLREQELRVLEEFLCDRVRTPQCLTCFSDNIGLLPETGQRKMPDGRSYTIHGVGFADFSAAKEFTIDKLGRPSCRTKR